MKVLIIGGGFFGCNVAYFLSKDQSFQITLADKESQMMSRASKHNHNRLHLGYHYLRSINTANQSIEGIHSFMENYRDAIIHNFPNYYAIASNGSKSSVSDFINYCNKLDISFQYEFPEKEILNPNMVQECFKVPEPIFDHNTLAHLITKNITKKNIHLLPKTQCSNIRESNNGFKVSLNGKDQAFDVVINCTYAQLNSTHEGLITENQEEYIFEEVLIPIFNYNMKKVGVTVMDGEFCSIMPKGLKENQFLLYHVKESVLQKQTGFFNSLAPQKTLNQAIETILSASTPYYPFLKEVKIDGYWKDTRVVKRNLDDERLTEIKSYDNLKGYYSIFSGKVTTCVKTAMELKATISNDFN